MDITSDFENMDVLLGNENANPIERELTDTINGSLSKNDLRTDPHIRTNPSGENENRNFSHGGQPFRQDRILESMQTLSNEINMRLSQEKDAMLSMMHSQINGAISEGVIPEIENIMSSVYSGNRDTESGSSSNNQENNSGTIGLKTKITKKDCRSAFDLGDTEDIGPYNSVAFFPKFAMFSFRLYTQN